MRTSDIQKKFPILSIEENGLIVNKNGDITVAFELTYPEIFSASAEDYEQLHRLFISVLRIMPQWSIIHLQDYYISENYKSKRDEDFMQDAFELAFNERPFLSHTCYFFLTQSYKNKIKGGAEVNMLSKTNIVQTVNLDPVKVSNFLDITKQIEGLLKNNKTISSKILDRQYILEQKIYEKYFGLGNIKLGMADIILKDGLQIGDNNVISYSIEDLEQLPESISTDRRSSKFSLSTSSMSLSFISPLGLMLPFDHILNRYFVIPDPEDVINEKKTDIKTIASLAFQDGNNTIREQKEEFLNNYRKSSNLLIKTHLNICAWSNNSIRLDNIRTDISTAINNMGCSPHYTTIGLRERFWAGIPGNATDLPYDSCFLMLSETAACFFPSETNYKDSPSAWGIKLTDRLTGKPVNVDFTVEPLVKNKISNYNKLVIGSSGTGKSYFINHYVRQNYLQGCHVLLVDVGNSYQGLCGLINEETDGEDGIYYTYTNENPISFNPFYTDDYIFDIEKQDSIKTLLLTLWKSEAEKITKTESGELGSAVNEFIQLIKNNRKITPNFNSFYEFMRDTYRTNVENRIIKVSKDDFNIDNFLTTLRQYYSGGRFDFLLNSPKNIDLINKRFIVFEIDQIKDNADLLPIVTIIIMEAYINKMRRLQSVRKLIIIEEAWKAITKTSMAEYVKYLFKTVRKFKGEAVVVTQEIDDLLSSEIIKKAIISNCNCNILLDMRKFQKEFDELQKVLGLSDHEKSQILSINTGIDSSRPAYKEVFIGLPEHSAVYATEVSTKEHFLYSTNPDHKLKFFELVEELGSYKAALNHLSKTN